MNYLPKGEENTKSFGGIDVTVKQIVKKADYTLTTLNIADSKVNYRLTVLFFVFILFGFPLVMSCNVHVTHLALCHTERLGMSRI